MRQAARIGNGSGPTIFRRALEGALSIARQNSRPPAILRSAAAARGPAPRGAGPRRPPPFVARKAAMGAADPTRGSSRHDRPRRNWLRTAARLLPTERLLDELQLYGYRPFDAEPDPRPLPEAHAVQAPSPTSSTPSSPP